jgi:hypothetical protein
MFKHARLNGAVELLHRPLIGLNAGVFRRLLYLPFRFIDHRVNQRAHASASIFRISLQSLNIGISSLVYNNDTMPEKRKLLLTGAAGRIGTYYRNHVGDRHTLRLVDIAPIKEPGDHETLQLDLSDPEAARHACAGMETVLHLAANPHTDA